MSTNRTRTIRVASALAALTLAAAGCSEDSSVGSGVEVGGGGGPGALRDQSTTTVAGGAQAAAPTTRPQGQAAIQTPRDDDNQPDGGATNTTQPPPEVTEETVLETTTTQPARETIIKITDAGTSFDPVIAQAATGTKVTWENTGTAPRQVADRDNRYFVSPMIEPGGKYSWTVNAPAGTTINYRDTTRPYAQAAKIEVY